ncbi:hypothetical protein NCLIV_054930 [Neospora caninum Liverpool]|uniref:Uncharacterized protein n=1 Tax=Neospora caninum (strain Liverpool) TaxID=572307 RepID=F0VMX2_NEOCL|nr:hypothetical protein NCLIV_054930 [Neospora caninum Liverpool]CBZ55068.1 hypothetical protein NCLIV_054930 [Neospora caninum Liverpool]|eukprot:XP_003885096.1 hypothetical protein NCLIV_054930 [Neospora caninum Liverpool]
MKLDAREEVVNSQGPSGCRRKHGTQAASPPQRRLSPLVSQKALGPHTAACFPLLAEAEGGCGVSCLALLGQPRAFTAAGPSRVARRGDGKRLPYSYSMESFFSAAGASPSSVDNQGTAEPSPSSSCLSSLSRTAGLTAPLAVSESRSLPHVRRLLSVRRTLSEEGFLSHSTFLLSSSLPPGSSSSFFQSLSPCLIAEVGRFLSPPDLVSLSLCARDLLWLSRCSFLWRRCCFQEGFAARWREQLPPSSACAQASAHVSCLPPFGAFHQREEPHFASCARVNRTFRHPTEREGLHLCSDSCYPTLANGADLRPTSCRPTAVSLVSTHDSAVPASSCVLLSDDAEEPLCDFRGALESPRTRRRRQSPRHGARGVDEKTRKAGAGRDCWPDRDEGRTDVPQEELCCGDVDARLWKWARTAASRAQEDDASTRDLLFINWKRLYVLNASGGRRTAGARGRGDAFLPGSFSSSFSPNLLQSFAREPRSVCVVRVGSVDLLLPLPPLPRRALEDVDALDASLPCFVASPFSQPPQPKRDGDTGCRRDSLPPEDPTQNPSASPSGACSPFPAREKGVESREGLELDTDAEKLLRSNGDRDVLTCPRESVCACMEKRGSGRSAKVNAPVGPGPFPSGAPHLAGQQRQARSRVSLPLAPRALASRSHRLVLQEDRGTRDRDNSLEPDLLVLATPSGRRPQIPALTSAASCDASFSARVLHEIVASLLSPEDRTLSGRLRYLRAGRPGLLVLDTDELCPLQHFLFERPVALAAPCFVSRESEDCERRARALAASPSARPDASAACAPVSSGRLRARRAVVLDWPLPPSRDSCRDLSLLAPSSALHSPSSSLCAGEAARPLSGRATRVAGDTTGGLALSLASLPCSAWVPSGRRRPGGARRDSQAVPSRPRAGARFRPDHRLRAWGPGSASPPGEETASSDSEAGAFVAERVARFLLGCRSRLSPSSDASSPSFLSAVSLHATQRSSDDSRHDAETRWLCVPSGLAPAPQRLLCSGAEVAAQATALVANAFEPLWSGHPTAAAAGVLLASLVAAFTASVSGALAAAATAAAAVVAARGGAGACSAAAALSSAAVHSDYAFDEEDEEGHEQDGLATLFAFLFLENSHYHHQLSAAHEDRHANAQAATAPSVAASSAQSRQTVGGGVDGDAAGRAAVAERRWGEGDPPHGASEAGGDGACGEGDSGDGQRFNEASFLKLLSPGLVALFSNVSFSSWIAACFQLVAVSRLLSVLDSRGGARPASSGFASRAGGEETGRGRGPWGDAYAAEETCETRGEGEEAPATRSLGSVSASLSEGQGRLASLPPLRLRKRSPVAPSQSLLGLTRRGAQKNVRESAGVAAAAGLTAWIALAATGSPGAAAALAATASFVASGKAKFDGSTWVIGGGEGQETERGKRVAARGLHRREPCQATEAHSERETEEADEGGDHEEEEARRRQGDRRDRREGEGREGEGAQRLKLRVARPRVDAEGSAEVLPDALSGSRRALGDTKEGCDATERRVREEHEPQGGERGGERPLSARPVSFLPRTPAPASRPDESSQQGVGPRQPAKGGSARSLARSHAAQNEGHETAFCVTPSLLSRLLHAPLASAHRLGVPSPALLLFLRVRLPSVSRWTVSSCGDFSQVCVYRSSLCGAAQGPWAVGPCCERDAQKRLPPSRLPEPGVARVRSTLRERRNWRPVLASEEVEVGLLLSREATIKDLWIHIFVSLRERGLLPWSGGDVEDEDVPGMRAAGKQNASADSQDTERAPSLFPASTSPQLRGDVADAEIGKAPAVFGQRERRGPKGGDTETRRMEPSRQKETDESRQPASARSGASADDPDRPQKKRRHDKHVGLKKTLFRAWLVSSAPALSAPSAPSLQAQPPPEAYLVRDCRFFFGERLCLVLAPVPFSTVAAHPPLPPPLVLSLDLPLGSPHAARSSPVVAEEGKLRGAGCTAGGRSAELVSSLPRLLARSSVNADEASEGQRKTEGTALSLASDASRRPSSRGLEEEKGGSARGRASGVLEERTAENRRTGEKQDARRVREGAVGRPGDRERAGETTGQRFVDEAPESVGPSRCLQRAQASRDALPGGLPASASGRGPSWPDSSLHAAAAWLGALRVALEEPERGSPVFVLCRDAFPVSNEGRKAGALGSSGRSQVERLAQRPLRASPSPAAPSASVAPSETRKETGETRPAGSTVENSRDAPSRSVPSAGNGEEGSSGEPLAAYPRATRDSSVSRENLERRSLACSRRLLRSTADARQFEFHPDLPDVILSGHKDGSIQIIDSRRDCAVAGLAVDSGPILGLTWLHHHPGRLVCAASATGAPYYVAWDLAQFLGEAAWLGDRRRERGWSRRFKSPGERERGLGRRRDRPISHVDRDGFSSTEAEDVGLAEACSSAEDSEGDSSDEDFAPQGREATAPRAARCSVSHTASPGASRFPRQRDEQSGGSRRGGPFGAWRSSSSRSSSLRVVHTGVSFDQQLSSLSVSCTDDFLLLSGFSPDLSLHDIATGQRLGTLQRLHSGSINTVRFSSCSPHIFATASFDQTCKVWDLRQRIGLSASPGKTAALGACEGPRASPRQPRLDAQVPGSLLGDFRRRPWPPSRDRGASSAVPVQAFPTGSPNVMCAFSDDGRWLLCSGIDTVLRQYALPEYKAVPDRFDLPSARANAATNFRRSFYLKGSRRFVTGGTEESMVRIFDVNSGENLGHISFRDVLPQCARQGETSRLGPYPNRDRSPHRNSVYAVRGRLGEELRRRSDRAQQGGGGRDESLERRFDRDRQEDGEAELAPSRNALNTVGSALSSAAAARASPSGCREGEETSRTRGIRELSQRRVLRTRNGRRLWASHFPLQSAQDELEGPDTDSEGVLEDDAEPRERSAVPPPSSPDLGESEHRTQLSAGPSRSFATSISLPSLYSPEVWTRAASFAAAGGEFFWAALRELYVHFQWRLLQMDQQNKRHLREENVVQAYSPSVPAASEEYIQSLRGHPCDENAFAALVAMSVNTPYSERERGREVEASAPSQTPRTQKAFVVLTQLDKPRGRSVD